MWTPIFKTIPDVDNNKTTVEAYLMNHETGEAPEDPFDRIIVTPGNIESICHVGRYLQYDIPFSVMESVQSAMFAHAVEYGIELFTTNKL